MTDSRKLVLATTNPHKGREMTEILKAAGLDLELLTLADFPNPPIVEESGATFIDNARLKAQSAAEYTGLAAIADDGGLVIDALDGLPGVKSHRFLGETTSFVDKMSAILEMMRSVPDERRTCRFQCAVVVAIPGDDEIACNGVCEGVIAREMRGANGFGYDPIVMLPRIGKHMAELLPEEKHRISHRGKALACAIAHLRGLQ